MTEPRLSRAAAVQMTSGTDIDGNLEAASRLIAAAVADGAELVVLPENFSFMGADDAARVAVAEAEGQGPAQSFAQAEAALHGIWLVAGTIPIAANDGRIRSRSLLLSPDGAVVAGYDKIHLFDVELPAAEGESYRESASTVAGERIVCAATGLGRVGMAVCYDIRFPALFARLAALGMDLLTLPAAFTVPTGRVHWRPLLTARAIESLSFVVASGQCGQHPGARLTWGHSAVIGPWGEVLAACGDEPGFACADIDMIALAQLRRQFPVLEHGRELN